jgi:SAM-dependent methyltransferase
MVSAQMRRELVTRFGPRTWKSRAVARQHRDLVLRELRHPDDVPPFRAFRDLVTALIHDSELPDPATLADIGCGAGHYGELLEQFFPRRFVYTGYDYSDEMVATARALWPGRNFSVKDVFDEAGDLSRFDVVLAGALVDVLSDVQAALDVLFGSEAPYVLLHRQRMTDSKSHVERTTGYRLQSTFASYLNRADLDRTANRHGRTVTHAVTVQDGIQSFIVALEASP